MPVVTSDALCTICAVCVLRAGPLTAGTGTSVGQTLAVCSACGMHMDLHWWTKMSQVRPAGHCVILFMSGLIINSCYQQGLE
jgi:hypothetical protein